MPWKKASVQVAFSRLNKMSLTRDAKKKILQWSKMESGRKKSLLSFGDFEKTSADPQLEVVWAGPFAYCGLVERAGDVVGQFRRFARNRTHVCR